MPRRDEVTRKGTIEALHRHFDTPDLIHAQFHLLVHDRSSSAGTCSCCGSGCSKVVDDLPDIEVVIDTNEGARYLRHTFPGSGPVRRPGLPSQARRRSAPLLSRHA